MKGFRQRVVCFGRRSSINLLADSMFLEHIPRKAHESTEHVLMKQQLSRAKDGNKISKKGKGDQPSGTASPHGTASPAGSASATPSSSTQNLVDSKSRTSTSSDTSNGGHAQPPTPDAVPSQPRMQFVSSQPGMTSTNANGPSTPGRFGGQQVPPSVVISPSAPVCMSFWRQRQCY